MGFLAIDRIVDLPIVTLEKKVIILFYSLSETLLREYSQCLFFPILCGVNHNVFRAPLPYCLLIHYERLEIKIEA